MSDIGYPTAGEPDATGGGRRRMFNLNIGTQMNIDLPGLDRAQAQIGAVTDALRGMKETLRDIGQSGYGLAQGINSLFEGISRSAQKARQDVTALNSAIGGVGAGGGGGGGVPAAPGGGGAPAYVGAATASAGAAMASAGAAGGGALPGGGYAPPAGVSLAGAVGSAPPWEKESFARTLALTPLRFMRERLSTNRQTALATSGALGMQSFATGIGTQQMMQQLAMRPGQIEGTVTDYLSLMNMAPQFGAMYGWGGQNAPRAAGFLRGVQQMQMISPMTPVTELAQSLGGYSGNVGAQQAGAYYTGGAYSMVKPGGGQKSLDEWAESILKWLLSLRSGSKRGVMFSYGELMAQYFPGSNIDAWFNVNQVPQDMRQFWWSYALAKAGQQASENDRIAIQPEQSSVAWQRLKATTATTKSEFQLAGTMAGSYANRETANRWFNETMGSLVNQVVPTAVSKGPLSWVQYLPDTIEELLMTFLERSGGVGTVLGGALSYSGVASDALGSVFNGLFGDVPDVGDVGDYGELGGTTTAGLHPDLRKKVNRMMNANPRLRVTSGLRDLSTQRRLRAKGHTRVSGRPSAHTRGMAADLGPPSEYNWITANAAKFGLTSGISHGEPWHVGLGDVGDIWDWIWGSHTDLKKEEQKRQDTKDVAGNIDVVKGFEDLYNASQDETGQGPGFVTAMGGFINTVLNLLGGALTGSGKREPDLKALEYKPKLYEQFPRKFTLGIFPTQQYVESHTPMGGGGGGGGGGGPTGPYAPGTPQEFYSGEELTRAKATALLAHNVGGWSGEDLVKMVAIAGRESSWTPTAHRSDTPGKPDWKGDRGLFQINEIWNDDLTNQGIISNPVEGTADLYNPTVNTKAARFIFDQQGWTAWSTYNAGLTEDQLTFARQAVHSANLGDLPELAAYAASPPTAVVKSTPVYFYNTFNVGGGSSGVDMRRSVTLMADQLEDEMKKRLTRVS